MNDLLKRTEKSEQTEAVAFAVDLAFLISSDSKRDLQVNVMMNMVVKSSGSRFERKENGSFKYEQKV